MMQKLVGAQLVSQEWKIDSKQVCLWRDCLSSVTSPMSTPELDQLYSEKEKRPSIQQLSQPTEP